MSIIKKWLLWRILCNPPKLLILPSGFKSFKYFSIWISFIVFAPLNKGSWPFCVIIKLIHFRFFSIMSSKNSGTYFWLSLITSLQKIKYLAKKNKSLGFRDKGKPFLSKKFLISFSNSLIPTLKFSSYSLKTKPVRIIALKFLFFC